MAAVASDGDGAAAEVSDGATAAVTSDGGGAATAVMSDDGGAAVPPLSSLTGLPMRWEARLQSHNLPALGSPMRDHFGKDNFGKGGSANSHPAADQ